MKNRKAFYYTNILTLTLTLNFNDIKLNNFKEFNYFNSFKRN